MHVHIELYITMIKWNHDHNDFSIGDRQLMCFQGQNWFYWCFLQVKAHLNC